MIGYKKSTLERKSLSEVKMNRGAAICKKISEKCSSDFESPIIYRSSKDSENLETSLDVCDLQAALH